MLGFFLKTSCYMVPSLSTALCSGTEHMPNDYTEIEIQKYENRKKMPSKRTQTEKEGSQRNKEVTDRVFSDDFKCRSFTGMFSFNLTEASHKTD